MGEGQLKDARRYKAAAEASQGRRGVYYSGRWRLIAKPRPLGEENGREQVDVPPPPKP